MKALVVGGAGYIGFEISKVLTALDYDVYVLDIDDSKLPVVIRDIGRFIRDDVISAVGLRQEYHVIVNLVGGLDDANLYWVEQAIDKQAIAPFILRRMSPNARVIHISTQFVYDGGELHKERTKALPVTDYGRVQLMAEQGLVNDNNAVILRCGTVIGEATYTRWDTWGNHFLRAMEYGEPADVYHPNAVLCLISISNVLRAIEWAIGADPGVYNVADTIACREDLAKEILGEYPYTVRKSDTPDISVGMECSRILKAGFSWSEG